MSIIQYQNRNKFKVKAAVQYIFKKDAVLQLPPGYYSLDVCCIGGGAAGSYGGWYGMYPGRYGGSEWSRKINYAGLGGGGGFVKNTYNIKVPNNLEIKVEIGKGGIVGEYENIIYNSKKTGTSSNNITSFTSYLRKNNGVKGGTTFLKNNKDNSIIEYAYGGGTWLHGVFVANGDTFLPIDDTYEYWRQYSGLFIRIFNIHSNYILISDRGSNYRYFFEGSGNMPDYTKGGPIIELPDNIKNGEREYYMNTLYSYQFAYSDGNDYRAIQDYVVTPPVNLLTATCGQASYINMGETRIFKDGDYMAGGGRTPNCVSEDHVETYNAANIGENGAGSSPEYYINSYIYRSNGYRNLYVSTNIIKESTNALPNTGGGGAGGVGIIKSYYDNGTYRYLSNQNVIPPTNGGSGLCIVRCYSDDKRPNVNFVEGINSYTIQ